MTHEAAGIRKAELSRLLRLAISFKASQAIWIGGEFIRSVSLNIPLILMFGCNASLRRKPAWKESAGARLHNIFVNSVQFFILHHWLRFYFLLEFAFSSQHSTIISCGTHINYVAGLFQNCASSKRRNANPVQKQYKEVKLWSLPPRKVSNKLNDIWVLNEPWECVKSVRGWLRIIGFDVAHAFDLFIFFFSSSSDLNSYFDLWWCIHHLRRLSLNPTSKAMKEHADGRSMDNTLSTWIAGKIKRGKLWRNFHWLIGIPFCCR